jgi:hypothetical protein
MLASMNYPFILISVSMFVDFVYGMVVISPKSVYQAHKCVADFRNTGKVSKILVKYLHKVLHVYVDTQVGITRINIVPYHTIDEK